jgi:hypothetical protein
MDWNPLKLLVKAAQYPQSLASGIADFGPGMHGMGGRNSGNLNALARGARGGLTPSQLMRERASEGELAQLEGSTGGQVLAGIGGNAADLFLDPTMAASGTVQLPGKLGKLAKAAGTFGELGEDATKATRAAQAARRLYQGALLSGGDPGAALGAAFLVGGAEKYGGRLIGKLGVEAAEDMVGKSRIERELDGPALQKVQEEYEAAVDLLNRNVEGDGWRMLDPARNERNPLAVERWQPGAVNPAVPPSDHPVVRKAREMLLGGKAGTTDEALAADLFPGKSKSAVKEWDRFLWQGEAGGVLNQLEREGVLGPRERGALGRRPVMGGNRIDRTQVGDPFAGAGARFNEELLSQGMPVPSSQLGIGPGQAGVGSGLERLDIANLERVPTQTGGEAESFMKLLQGQAEPGGSRATAQPFVPRMEGMEPDIEMLRQMAQEFRGMPQALPATTAPYQRLPISLRDERFPPGRLEERLPAELTQPPEALPQVLPEPELAPVPVQNVPQQRTQVQTSLAGKPLEQQIAYYKMKAARGDAKAREIYMALLDELEESPMDKFLKLAGG